MSQLKIKTEPRSDDGDQKNNINSNRQEELNVKRQIMPPPLAPVSNARQRVQQFYHQQQHHQQQHQAQQQQQPQHYYDSKSKQRHWSPAAGSGGGGGGGNYWDAQGNCNRTSPPGTHCGEIFVANNARQWTFVCTFCNKSTRDIGDFICHIKMRHLQEYSGGYYDDDGDNDDDASMNSMHGMDDADGYEMDQDYLDCSGYLDVNVHTVDSNEDQDQLHARKFKNTSLPTLSTSPTKGRPTLAAEQHKSFIEKKLRASQDNINGNNNAGVGGGMGSAGTAGLAIKSMHFMDPDDDDEPTSSPNVKSATAASSTSIKQERSQSGAHTNGNDYRKQSANYDPFDNDKNEYGTGGGGGGSGGGGGASYDDDDDDEDFDNKLLLSPNDTLLDSSNGEVKTKRRQIRGTAYCALCNKTFQYYSLYRNHMIKHSNETPFKCSLCKKGFKSKQAIRYHMNTHQKKRFNCMLCDSSYYTENQFITHVLTHENASIFPCMVCGEILNTDKERNLHIATHTDERPYRCEFCNKRFRLRHHLSNHLKMHRQYRCEYCKADFTSAVYLRKPYACMDCEVRLQVSNKRGSSSGGGGGGSSREQGTGEDVNPLELFEAADVPAQPTECVDLAEMVSESDADEPETNQEFEEQDDEYDDDNDDDDDEGDDANYVGNKSKVVTKPLNKKFCCKYCHRRYSHSSGLNYHIRNKHR